jgi:hypothetical protein
MELRHLRYFVAVLSIFNSKSPYKELQLMATNLKAFLHESSNYR